MRSCRSWCLFRLVLAGILVAAYAAQLVSATVRSQAQMPRQQLFRRQNPFRPRGHQDMFTNPALSPPLNMTLRPRRGPPRKRDVLYTTPLEIVNSCDETIWPGILTQHGVGPGTGGFALEPNETRAMLVSWDWQGRVWGRANCSFNAEGDGPAQPMGVNGWGAACESCDCGGQLDCSVAVSWDPDLVL